MPKKYFTARNRRTFPYRFAPNMEYTPTVEEFGSESILQKYRPYSRKRTSYGQMNDWMRMARDTERAGGVPMTVTDNNWRATKSMSEDFNKSYDRAYNDLTSKIAYRYPNPGLARQRQGRIGGTWRHIKEVLGHGGSRVVYVDGLISVYDKEQFNQALSDESPNRPHIRRSKSDMSGFSLPPVGDSFKVGHCDADVARKLSLNSASKYKGFYRSK